MDSIKAELERILDENVDERAAAVFLRKHPIIMWRSFQSVRGHQDFVLAEFPFGSSFRADFVTLTGYSGAWEANYIELEPIQDRLVLANGTYSERIRGAIKQISDWREYQRVHLAAFRSDLSRWASQHDLLKFRSKSKSPPSTYSGHRLKDPESYMRETYWIVAGRRSEMSEQTRQTMNRLGRDSSIQFMTYDSSLDVADGPKFDWMP